MSSLAAPVPRTGVSARRVLVKLLLTGFFVLAAWLCGSAVASAATVEEHPAPSDPVGGLVSGTTDLLDHVTSKVPVVGDVVHNVTKTISPKESPAEPQSGGGLFPQLPPLIPGSTSTGSGSTSTGGWVNVSAPTATVTTEMHAEPAVHRHTATPVHQHKATKPASASSKQKTVTSRPAKIDTAPRDSNTVSAPRNHDKTPSSPDPAPDPATPTASVGHPGPSGDRGSASVAAITNAEAGSVSRASHGERSDTQYPLGAEDGLPSVSPD